MLRTDAAGRSVAIHEVWSAGMREKVDVESDTVAIAGAVATEPLPNKTRSSGCPIVSGQHHEIRQETTMSDFSRIDVQDDAATETFDPNQTVVNDGTVENADTDQPSSGGTYY